MSVPTSGTIAGPGDTFEEVVGNQPTGLTGTIGVRIVDNAGSTVSPRRTAGIAETPAASGIYVVVLTAPTGAGQYSIIWDTDPAGVISPTNSVIHALTVVAVAIAPQADSILCGLWLDPTTLSCAGVVAPLEATDVVQAASEYLYARTGYRYPGICTSTVRPCQDDCGCLADGCFSCQRPCNVVRLLAPVTEILSVTIDGQALAPSEYRIYDNEYLQRLGGWWPYQNLQLSPGSVGSWEVEFRHGASPPLAGVEAARELACKLVSLGSGEECVLPAHVTALARQGVNQQFDPAMAATLSTPSVSFFLETYGMAPAAVWSPDMPSEPVEVL